MHPRLASIFCDPTRVPGHVPPSLRETWVEVVRDFTRAGRTPTSAEVEAECARRVEQAHKCQPDLFSEETR